jgi:hypothetical protein
MQPPATLSPELASASLIVHSSSLAIRPRMSVSPTSTRSARGSIKASRTEAVRWAAMLPSARRWRCRSTPARTRHGKGSRQAHKVDPDAVDAHLRARYRLMGGHRGAASVSYHPHRERFPGLLLAPRPLLGGLAPTVMADSNSVGEWGPPGQGAHWLRDLALRVGAMSWLVVRSSSRLRGLPGSLRQGPGAGLPGER